jgi:hypothetical protein
MFVYIRDAVTLKIRLDISTKIMLIVFFISHKFLVLDALSKEQKHDKNYFVQNVIPELQRERFRFARQNTLIKFAARMDNSIYQNGTKVTNALDKTNIIRDLR